MGQAKPSVKNQYLAALSLNIITLTYGAFLGWPSASLLMLQSPISPLETGPMSDDDAGWVSSVSFIGGLLGAFIYAWFAGKLGRRLSLLLTAIPALIGWLIIPFAQSPLHLCIARFLGGSSAGAIFGVIPIYITEVADDNIRGVLGSFLMFAVNIGFLVAFILGYFFSYATVALIMVVPTIIYLSSFLFLPETPKYLLSRKKFEQAEKSYCFFHNTRVGETQLPESFKKELEKQAKGEEENTVDKSESSLSCQDFFNRKAIKALLIGIFLSTIYIFCGVPQMLNYAATIFQKASSKLSPNMSAIVVGAIQIVGSYMSTLLVEKCGRKPLLIASCLGTAIGQISLGIYAHFDAQGYDMQSFSWIPVTSFSIAIFFACAGILPLTYILIAELTPPKILNIGNMIAMIWMRICSVAMFKLLPLLMRYMGLHYMVYMYGVCCLVSIIVVLIFIPETKGKSIKAILELL